MKLNPNIKFYLIIGSENCTHHSLFDIVAMAVNNGVDVIQLREKNASTEKIVQIGNTIQPFLKIHNVPLIINDDIEAAKILDADGVHVGQHDAAYKTARKFLGPNKIIGLSIENAKQIDALKQYHDLDYIGVGPVFSTNTKKDAAQPLGITGLKGICQTVNIPTFAIGGIDLHNINDVMQTGVQGAAIVSAICSAENPAEVCALFSEKLL
ncbi:MAG: thiamine phosphate synthase [Gammaproteobacteria bacterium]